MSCYKEQSVWFGGEMCPNLNPKNFTDAVFVDIRWVAPSRSKLFEWFLVVVFFHTAVQVVLCSLRPTGTIQTVTWSFKFCTSRSVNRCSLMYHSSHLISPHLNWPHFIWTEWQWVSYLILMQSLDLKLKIVVWKLGVENCVANELSAWMKYYVRMLTLCSESIGGTEVVKRREDYER